MSVNLDRFIEELKCPQLNDFTEKIIRSRLSGDLFDAENVVWCFIRLWGDMKSGVDYITTTDLRECTAFANSVSLSNLTSALMLSVSDDMKKQISVYLG